MATHPPKLYLMLGYPGAGKTTAAEIICRETGAIHLSSDLVRLELFPEPTFTQSEHDTVYRELDARTQALLKQGKSVIYDANLNRAVHRQEKYDLCERVDAEAVLIWVKTPKSLARQRRIEEVDNHHLVPGHEDPGSMFERLVTVFEEPTADESYTELDGTKITPEYIREKLV